MRIEIHNEINEKLAAIWKQLEDESVLSIFQKFEWIKDWVDCVLTESQDNSVFVAVVYDENESVSIIFPLWVKRFLGINVLGFLGGDISDYHLPLVSARFGTNVEKVRKAWILLQHSLPKVDAIHLEKIPERVGARNVTLIDAIPVVKQGEAFSMTLPRSIAEFEEKLKKRIKQDSKRQIKRLTEIGEVCFITPQVGSAEFDTILNAFIDQKRARYSMTGVPDLLANDGVQCFYRLKGDSLADSDCIHLSALKVGDTIVAAHWGAVENKTFFYLMPSYTQGELRKYSPGRLLLIELIKNAIGLGLERFDFTVGGEEYKKDWCDTKISYYEYLKAKSLRGLTYVGYIRLRRYARSNPVIWKLVLLGYSFIRPKGNS